jgi:hypothetical protein
VILAGGLTIGAWIGAHTVKGGECLIRAALVVAALLPAGKLLGVYGRIGDRF